VGILLSSSTYFTVSSLMLAPVGFSGCAPTLPERSWADAI
jgi:hypothetical protein